MNMLRPSKQLKALLRFSNFLTFAIILPLGADAQIQPQVLVSFDGTNSNDPIAGLTLGPDGILYGTTWGGDGVGGSAFRVTTNGALTTLFAFGSTNGATVIGGLVVGPDGNFYGTTDAGGDFSVADGFGGGTVFRITANGDLTSLYAFPWSANPQDTPTVGPDGNIYGTETGMGETVFKVDTATGVLTNFVSSISFEIAHPVAGLTVGSDGILYGTSSTGGSSANGTFYKVTTNGVFSILASFDGTNGASPIANLTLAEDGSFYGVAQSGGEFGKGTLFNVTTNGDFTVLASFDGTNGEDPWGTLLMGPDGNLYGTTSMGGQFGSGTVFETTTKGDLTTLISFNGTNGAVPTGGLIVGSDGNFYGTTEAGGRFGAGTIFRLQSGAYAQSFGMTTNGFAVNVINVGGSGKVVVEASSDLIKWTAIQTNGPAATMQFIDTRAKTQQQFYRTVQQ